jgi:hypothetical protein
VRSFADGYKTIRAANPDHFHLTDKEIFRVMIEARMSIFPNVGQRAFIQPFLDTPSKGLRHLINGVLLAENAPSDPWSFLQSIAEVVNEELEKSGLPQSVIEGVPEFTPGPPEPSFSLKPPATAPPVLAKASCETKGTESDPVGCLIIAVASIAIVAALVFAKSHPPTPAVPTSATPSLAERSAAINKTFADLEIEYRALNARRSALDQKNPTQLATFNRDAADYTRRVQLARDEKARLDR